DPRGGQLDGALVPPRGNVGPRGDRRRLRRSAGAGAPAMSAADRPRRARGARRAARPQADEPATIPLRLQVNGERVEISAPPHHTLLEVLREEMGLTGTKHGCELGECGTCTVLVDGKPMLSCVTLPVECEGRQI